MPKYDRKIIVDEPLGYGKAVCVECGLYGERRLLPRFPHICGACLFPPHQVNEALERDDRLHDFLPVVSMIQRLHERNLAVGRIHTDDRMGND